MREANIIMRRGKTARDHAKEPSGGGTGHSPWSGKESELFNPAVRAYLDGLPKPKRPPRHRRTLTPQQESGRAVARQLALKGDT